MADINYIFLPFNIIKIMWPRCLQTSLLVTWPNKQTDSLQKHKQQHKGNIHLLLILTQLYLSDRYRYIGLPNWFIFSDLSDFLKLKSCYHFRPAEPSLAVVWTQFGSGSAIDQFMWTVIIRFLQQNQRCWLVLSPLQMFSLIRCINEKLVLAAKPGLVLVPNRTLSQLLPLPVAMDSPDVCVGSGRSSNRSILLLE